MSDTVQILASADQVNVVSVADGQTQQLAGFERGSVPLDAQVKGSAVDVSGYALLRTELSVAHPSGPVTATLRLTIETGQTDEGPWRVLHTFDPVTAGANQRAMLVPDNFVRTSHYWSSPVNNDLIRLGPKTWTFSVVADALPEA